MVAIGRHIEGVVLNPLEFVLKDDNKTVMVFESEEVAREFLVAKGIDPNILDDFTYQEVNSDGSPYNWRSNHVL